MSKKTRNTNSRYEQTKEKGIFYDKKTKDYRLTLFIGVDNNGKQQRKFERFSRFEQAVKRKKEFKAQKTLKQAPQPLKRVKLKEYIDIYFDSLILKETTLDGYKRICKRIKNCDISKKYLQDIGKKEILAYIKFLQDTTKMKAQTINKDLTFLSSVFESAYKDELIIKNPVKLVDKLKETEKFTANYYTKEELKIILTNIKDYHNKNVQLTYYLGLFLGLRRGEMAGLKWESIDFEKERIRIENNRVNVNGKAIDGSPKSITSERIIFLPKNQDFRNCLQQIRQWQYEKFGGCEYLMVNPQTGKPLCPQNLKRGISVFCKKFNLREIRIHDFRHTFASLSISSNELSVKEISTILGHGNTRITEQVYMHVMEDSKNRTIDVVSKIYENLLKS